MYAEIAPHPEGQNDGQIGFDDCRRRDTDGSGWAVERGDGRSHRSPCPRDATQRHADQSGPTDAADGRQRSIRVQRRRHRPSDVCRIPRARHAAVYAIAVGLAHLSACGGLPDGRCPGGLRRGRTQGALCFGRRSFRRLLARRRVAACQPAPSASWPDRSAADKVRWLRGEDRRPDRDVADARSMVRPAGERVQDCRATRQGPDRMPPNA